MSLSTYYLEYGRHVARLRRRRRRAYAPTNNTASHDKHEKINSWVSFSFLYEYRTPLKPIYCRKKINMLFAGLGSVRIVKNCDLGLENAALGLRPRAALSRPRSQFFTIRTDRKSANNRYIF